jgi:hypothetical protein
MCDLRAGQLLRQLFDALTWQAMVWNSADAATFKGYDRDREPGYQRFRIAGGASGVSDGPVVVVGALSLPAGTSSAIGFVKDRPMW